MYRALHGAGVRGRQQTAALLRFAVDPGRRVGGAMPRTLIASSSEVYGKSAKSPFREDDDAVYGPTTVGRWSYACSKAVDEYLALAHHRANGLPVVVSRFFNTVGPRQVGDYGMVLPRFVELVADALAPAAKHIPAIANGDLSADELAEVFVRATSSSYFLPGENTGKLIDWLERLAGSA